MNKKHDHGFPSRDAIVAYIRAHPGKIGTREIAREFGLKNADRAELKRMLREDDRILAANEVDMPYAYVVYDHARAKNVETIKSWLAMHDIILAGRYSEWEYYNSDHAFIAGRKAADTVKWAEPKAALAAE